MSGERLKGEGGGVGGWNCSGREREVGAEIKCARQKELKKRIQITGLYYSKNIHFFSFFFWIFPFEFQIIFLIKQKNFHTIFLY